MSQTGSKDGGYKITGRIVGLPDGDLFLVTDNEVKIDTLAHTKSVNGNFFFSGQVPAAAKSLRSLRIYIALSKAVGQTDKRQTRHLLRIRERKVLSDGRRGKNAVPYDTDAECACERMRGMTDSS